MAPMLLIDLRDADNARSEAVGTRLAPIGRAGATGSDNDMSAEESRQLHLVSAAEVDSDLAESIRSEAVALGFEFFAFKMKAPHPLTSPRVAWCSNYPLEWMRRYRGGDYVQRDPNLRHAMRSTRPVRWSDAFFARCAELRAESQSFGLVHGGAFPHRDSQGMVSVLSLARATPEISPAEWRDLAEGAGLLAQRCHETIRAIWQSALVSGLDRRLAGREVEVLRWSADGKTPGEIAGILGLKEAAVNFHLRSAALKLGTSNRTATAVRAALLGLI